MRSKKQGGVMKTVLERLSEDVTLLEKLKPDQVTQFSELALTFLQTGANKKMYKSAAKHIGASVEEVGRCIMGMSKLFINGMRRRIISRIAFSGFMEKVGTAEVAIEPMAAFYAKNRDAIQRCVGQLSIQLPSFQKLDWRLDVEVSRRMAHNVFQPNFMFKLDTIDNEPKSQYMQVDMKTVKFLRSQLKAALQESSSVHQKRVAKYVR